MWQRCARSCRGWHPGGAPVGTAPSQCLDTPPRLARGPLPRLCGLAAADGLVHHVRRRRRRRRALCRAQVVLRGEKLEMLQERTEDLAAAAATFQKQVGGPTRARNRDPRPAPAQRATPLHGEAEVHGPTPAFRNAPDCLTPSGPRAEAAAVVAGRQGQGGHLCQHFPHTRRHHYCLGLLER